MRAILACVLLVALGAAAWLLLSQAGAPADVPFDAVAEDGAPESRGAVEERGRGGACVLVLATDHRTPVAGREVRLFRRAERRMELPRHVATVASGGDGLACFGDLEPGGYLACGPGAEPGEPAPWTARWEEPRTAERPVIVLDRSELASVVLEVQARFTPRFGVSSKVWLMRRDDWSGTPWELPDIVRPGAAEVRIEVPEGRYEVRVRPLGELLVAPSARELDVTGREVRHVVALEANPAAVDVTLTGIPADAFPVRVYPQPADDVLQDRPGTLYWGEHRWRSATATVPVLDGERRVLAFGRDDVFRSVATHRLDRASATVAMAPATRLVVDWFAWQPEADTGATLFVEHGEEAQARTLAPVFGAARPDLERPAMSGELVVPRGPLRLECRTAEGELRFARDVVAEGPELHVRVEDR